MFVESKIQKRSLLQNFEIHSHKAASKIHKIFKLKKLYMDFKIILYHQSKFIF